MPADAPEIKTVHVVITGRVQEVWYRGWMVARASELALSGWVRNRRDGNVEALITGEARAADALVAACHEGPPAAEVSRVEVRAAADRAGDLAPGFHQAPNA